MKSASVRLLGYLLAIAPLSAHAEPAATPNGEAETLKSDASGSDQEVDQLHIPGYDGTRVGASAIEFEFAPEIASHNPLGSNSRTSTSTSTSLTFITTQPLSDRLEVEFDAGPSMLLEHGDIAESSLAASLELRTHQSSSGFAGFARYELAHDMDSFFGSSLATDQTLTGGLRYGANVGAGSIGVELAPRWVNSNHNTDDYLAAELFIDAFYPVMNDGIGLIGEVSIDRRWYLNNGSAAPGKRRDWRFEGFAGIDIANLLAPPPGRFNPLHALGVGVLWLEVDSNLDSADRSAFKVLPAITLRADL
ncbi:hypothetical protein EDF56_1012 [Novosphingobium sp. PhB165]|uniref:hypothetical protein n=1 Tax=Novosphingobium sp. PhB165 TaxID=2485105 RepID=UPI00104D4EFC|nr:hypothetical protein [Novosphingobium sp. PhB165]TCM21338.1 hypothetical protein EDF56_1012 [Novosphingobium sp. PhB165]